MCTNCSGIDTPGKKTASKDYTRRTLIPGSVFAKTYRDKDFGKKMKRHGRIRSI